MPMRKAVHKTYARRAKKREDSRPGEAARDTAELLIDNMLHSGPRTATGLHTLLYGLSPSMHEIAYVHGFGVGRSMHGNNATLDDLLRALEVGGMGKALYAPAESLSYITSTSGARTEIESGMPMHHYESGMISGFMASYTGRGISTHEASCMWDGSDRCVFVSGVQAPWKGGTGIGAEEFVERAVALVNGIGNPGRGADYYTYLSIQPLLYEGMVKRLAAPMLNAGTGLHVRGNAQRLSDIVDKAGGFLGINARLVRNTKAKKSIVLRYNSFSSANYIKLTVPMFIGIIGDGHIRKVKSSLRNGAYSVQMDFSLMVQR